MEDSGLDEIWATVYARKSLPKMMEEKAYTKTLRACLLTDAALHIVLIHPLHVDFSEPSVSTEDLRDLHEESGGQVSDEEKDNEEDVEEEVKEKIENKDHDEAWECVEGKKKFNR